jgi:hypothetical protein
MTAKLSEGDTIAMQSEVTKIHEDGRVTVRLAGYDVPIATRGEASEPRRQEQADPERRKPQRAGPVASRHRYSSADLTTGNTRQKPELSYHKASPGRVTTAFQRMRLPHLVQPDDGFAAGNTARSR